MGCVGAGSAREKGGKGALYGATRRREGGSDRCAVAAAGRQRPMHVGHGSLSFNYLRDDWHKQAVTHIRELR
jgi:hypothetical protein